MNKKYDEIIRKRLKMYRKECLECIGDSGWYDNRKETVILLNKILKGIPVEAWPKKPVYQDEWMCGRKIASNNWCLTLRHDEGRRSADLKHRNDDHTAWVIEHRSDKGRFIDFDIGGS